MGSSTWASHLLTLAGVKISFFPEDQTLKLQFFLFHCLQVCSLNSELLQFLQVFIDLSQALSVVGARTISDIQLLQVEIEQRTPIHRVAESRFSPIKVAVVLLGELKVDNVLF